MVLLTFFDIVIYTKKHLLFLLLYSGTELLKPSDLLCDGSSNVTFGKSLRIGLVPSGAKKMVRELVRTSSPKP